MPAHPLRGGLAAAVTAVLASTAGAAEPVEPVTVTATRTAQTADETVAPVTVITRQEIEQSGAATLPDLLAGRPGIDISSNGGFGKSTTVNLRGLGGGEILYLVNGNRIAAPGSIEGAPSIQHIPAAQIERIEIVRGPRSALYGSNALGGVINIITRRPSDTRFGASASYGTYSTREAQATASGQGDAASYNLSVAGYDTEGYDVRDDNFTDNDGYENGSVNGRSTWSPTDHLDLSVDILANEGMTEFDNCSDRDASFPAPTFGDCHTDFKQRTFGISTDYRLSTRWSTSLELSHNREERRNFFQDNFNNEFDGATSTVSWKNDIQVGTANLFSLGIDGTRDTVEQPDDFTKDSRERTEAFLQWQTHAAPHNLVLGARAIDDEQFGNHSVGSIDYGFQAAERLRVLVSAGTAFKAPSLFQLYSPQFGNSELEAQKSTTVELGLAGQPPWGKWTIRSYRTYVRDLIEFVSSQYQNVADEVEINGLEFAASAKIGGWNTNVSYSWSEPIDQSTGNVLANRAERSFRLSLDRSFGAWSTGATVEAQSDRTGSSFSDPVAGYGILNLRGGYRISRHWRIRATIENVGDIEYPTNSGYRAPGHEIFASVEYRPGRGF
jgi:vitamin B12 transporter